MIKENERKRKGIMIKRLGGFCLLFIAPFLFLTTAHGAQYPTRTIQVVSPFPPGGTTDMVARLINKKLSTLLGQSVVVVNKSGGGGTIGIQGVAAAPADGYTILVSSPSIMVSPLTVKGIPFNFKNFTPINLATIIPSAIAVRKDAPWKTLEELIADAKRNPGKFTYSSAGPGSQAHLAGELFKMVTATDITHIPMDGTASTGTALLGGHVNMTFLAFSGLRSYVEAGSLRALAVMSRNRLEEFPDIPTTVEKGYPKLISVVWNGIFVSAKTSPVIVKKLSEVFKEVLKDKEVIGLLKKVGMEVENLGPEEAAKWFAEEEKWVSEVIKAAKIGQLGK
jgi:tripartite-type tricarboxylate transporter receptor subunit TctC